LTSEKKKKIVKTARSVAWELIPFSGALSRRGLHPSKLAYDHMLVGWPAQLTASDLN